jgi:hypothetical protein
MQKPINGLPLKRRKRLKDLRLHVTRLGIFGVVLLVVLLFPSPALKAKPPLFRRHTADTAWERHALGFRCRSSTETAVPLRCSRCDSLSTTSTSILKLIHQNSVFFVAKERSQRTFGTSSSAIALCCGTAHPHSARRNPDILQRGHWREATRFSDLTGLNRNFSVPSQYPVSYLVPNFGKQHVATNNRSRRTYSTTPTADRKTSSV